MEIDSQFYLQKNPANQMCMEDYPYQYYEVPQGQISQALEQNCNMA